MVSFRREKYIPKGGPDGGDGGRGGDVILRASRHVTTLAGIQHMRRYRAQPGRPGGTAQCSGRAGESLVLEVPVGTLIRDAEKDHVLRDLAHDHDEVVVVQGGSGGRGNKHFAHATNQAPRRATDGYPGETRRLKLELRLVADVGLVGKPNAGKSTFLSRVSAARPKVAEYPFTTLTPVLGIVQPDDIGLVIADIPGLIEGAHAGAGLGDRFLRHIQRTRVLFHMVDVLEGPEGAVASYRAIREELALSGWELHERPAVLGVSRIDTVQDASPVVDALRAATGGDVFPFSSHTGVGVPAVLAALTRLVRDDP